MTIFTLYDKNVQYEIRVSRTSQIVIHRFTWSSPVGETIMFAQCPETIQEQILSKLDEIQEENNWP
jgi:hypothetical protein